MKRNDHRTRPRLNEREQMHRNMPEINMEQAGAGSLQKREQTFQFHSRDLPRLIEQLAKPKAAKKVRGRFPNGIDRLERKRFGIFSFLRDDNWPDPSQPGNLPVNVKHFRLEKRRAI